MFNRNVKMIMLAESMKRKKEKREELLKSDEDENKEQIAALDKEIKELSVEYAKSWTIDHERRQKLYGENWETRKTRRKGPLAAFL